MTFCRLFFLLFVFCFLPSLRAQAEYTPMLMGPLGLNTVPSARMDDPGTVRLSFSTLDPYAHVQLGFQLAEPLYIALRQSAEISSIEGSADRLYPGIDFKLRLAREGPRLPEISVGAQTLSSSKRMASEYIVFSKRWNDFDFTGGLDWGRRYGDGLFNPFGGVEYFTPWMEELSLKADWSADHYRTEEALSDYDSPAPWSVGFAYRPASWVSLGAALAGDKIMGTLSFQGPLSGWPRRASRVKAAEPLLFPRTGDFASDKMAQDAQRADIRLYNISEEDHSLRATMEVDENTSLSFQIGRAVRSIANHSGPDIEELHITPVHYGLRGPDIKLQRADLERALAQNQGSPQEIWRHTAIVGASDESGQGWRPVGSDLFDIPAFRLVLDNKISLFEKDQGFLYRTSLVGETARPLGTNFMAGGALRLNLADNLQNLHNFRPLSLLPVRSDEDRFARQRVGIDRLYLGYTRSLSPDVHVMAAVGNLEEMYTGAGGEILWRPFGRTFALGADAWQVFRRDPGFEFNGDHVLTGHLNAWYEIPETDLTAQARIGRYLAEDLGATLALDKRLRNGAHVRAYVTMTDRADFDPLGGKDHLYGGLELTLPFGDTKFTPNGSAIRMAATPLGRDAGQTLDAPLHLYDMTEPFSLRPIAANWTDIVD